MRRRNAIAGLGVALTASPVAHAQTRGRMIAAFIDVPAGDVRGQTRVAAFAQGLQEAGWMIGRNLRVEYRWRGDDAQSLRDTARELLALNPDAILASSTPVTAAFQSLGSKVPVVFVAVTDPVGAGFVESFARPGGNFTGFSTIDYTIGGKWVEILKEMSPTLRAAAVLIDGSLPSMAGQIASIEAAADQLGVTLTKIELRDAGALEQSLVAFAAAADGGIIATASPLAGLHRDLIIRIAAAHRLPAIYPYDHFAAAGGLAAFGPDLVDAFRGAAGYVGRILRGARPSELPVQAPSKIDLILNLRTARALDLTLTPSLLLRADEVIE